MNNQPLTWVSLEGQKTMHMAFEGATRSLCLEDVNFATSERICHKDRVCFRCELIAEQHGETVPPIDTTSRRTEGTQGLRL